MKGQHFILDVECQEEDKLMDKALIGQILNELPRKINMNTLAEPQVVEGLPHNPGITGVVIMETSNIIIHTFLNIKKISFDVFSVKDIDQEKVLNYFKDKFDFTIIRKDLIDRL